jgi:hypothetical protein
LEEDAGFLRRVQRKCPVVSEKGVVGRRRGVIEAAYLAFERQKNGEEVTINDVLGEWL